MNTDSHPPDALSSWLGAELRRRGWSLTAFAERLGTDKGVVGHWVRGSRVPSPRSIDRIADVLGVDVDTVLTLAGHRPHIDEPAPDDRVAAIGAKLRRAKLSDDELQGIEETVEMLIKQAMRFRRA